MEYLQRRLGVTDVGELVTLFLAMYSVDSGTFAPILQLKASVDCGGLLAITKKLVDDAGMPRL